MLSDATRIPLLLDSVKSAPCCGERLSVDEALLALDRAVEEYQWTRSLVRTGSVHAATPAMMAIYRGDADRAFQAMFESVVNVNGARRGYPAVLTEAMARIGDAPISFPDFEIGIRSTDVDAVADLVYEQVMSGEGDEDLQSREHARIFTVAALMQIVADIVRYPLRRLSGANREPCAYEAGIGAVRSHISRQRKAA